MGLIASAAVVLAIVAIGWGFTPSSTTPRPVAATIRHIGTPNSTASLTSGKADVVVDADAPGQGAIRVVVDSKLIANCRVGGAISAVPVKLNLGLTRWEAALNPC